MSNESDTQSTLRAYLRGYTVVMGTLLFWWVYAAHEATHAALGRLMGGRVVRWSLYPRPYVDVAYPAEKSMIRDAIGGLAPFLVGFVFAVPFTVLVWQPLVVSSAWWSTHLAVYLGVGYLMYSMPLGNDMVPLRDYLRG